MSRPSATPPDRKLGTDPRLVLYRDPAVPDGLVAERLDTRDRWLIATPEQVEILFRAAHAAVEDDLIAWARAELGLSDADARAALTALLDQGLIVTADDEDVEAFAGALERWQHYGWLDAFRYAAATRDVDFLDYGDPGHLAVDSERMAAYAAQEPHPPVYKRYADRPFVTLERDLRALDDVDLGLLLIDDLAEKPTAAGPVSARQLSTLLLFSLGQTGVIELPNQGELLLKAVPSGGARHPIEGYLLALDTELARATYHYSVEQHGLEEITRLPAADELRRMLPEISAGPRFAPKAILLLTANLERPMWRYRDDSRSFRVMLHDAGHVLEQVKLVARALGLVAYVASGVAERMLGPWLGVDPDECVLDYVLLA